MNQAFRGKTWWSPRRHAANGMEDSMINGLHSLEETINKLLEAMIASKTSSSYHNNDRDGFLRTHRDETNGGRKKTDNECGRHVF